jgi:hypothetical protein
MVVWLFAVVGWRGLPGYGLTCAVQVCQAGCAEFGQQDVDQ